MPGKGCVAVFFNGSKGKPHWEDDEDEGRLLGGEGLAMQIPGEIEFQEGGKNGPEAGARFMFQEHLNVIGKK